MRWDEAFVTVGSIYSHDGFLNPGYMAPRSWMPFTPSIDCCFRPSRLVTILADILMLFNGDSVLPIGRASKKVVFAGTES